MQTRYLCFAASAVLSCSYPLAVHGNDAAMTAPVVVTATRLTEHSNAPASVSVIGADDIARSPAKNLPELLALEAGVTSRSLFGNGTRDSIDMRGFGASAGQNTLILLDGRRLTDVDLAAVDYSAIPLAAIERIEIVRGSGAVLYGDGAVGGAINIITKSPGRTGTRGSASLASGSYDTRALDAQVAHGTGGFAATASANRVQSDGYRENNHLAQTNLLSDFRWQQGGRELFLKLGADEQNLRLPGARRVQPPSIDQLATDRRGTSTPGDYADKNGVHVTAGVLAFLPDEMRLTVDGGFRRKHQQAYFRSSASYIDSELTTWSFTPRIALRRGLLGAGGETKLGLDYYRSGYDSDRAQSPETVGTPIHRLAIDQNSIALYGQTTDKLGRATHLTAGARIQRVDLRASDAFNPAAPGAFEVSGAADFRQRDDETAYEVGLRQFFNSRLSMFARVGRSVRFATVDELFESKYDSTTFTSVALFSPLKPQTADALETGLDLVRDDLKVSTSAYLMTLENEIHYNPDTSSNDNLDPTRRYGLTLSVSNRFTTTTRAKLDYARTRSEFREGIYAGKEVPLVARHSGSLTLSWDPFAKTTLSATARYAGSKHFDNDQSNTFARIPHYTFVDVKFAQKLGSWHWDAAVNNVFDKNAFDYGVRSLFTAGTYNAYPLPERQYTLSVGREF